MLRTFYTDKEGYLNQEYFEKKFNYTDPLHSGIKLEIYFAFSLSLIPFYHKNSWIYINDNSGNNDPISYDIFLHSFIGHYAFDVKGTNGTRIYAELTPEYIENKLKFADLYQCYFAFPKFDTKELYDPNNWFLHRLTSDSYLIKLHSKPYYPKLVDHSFELSKLPFMLNPDESELEHRELMQEFIRLGQNKNNEELSILSELEKEYLWTNKEGYRQEGNYVQ